MPALKAPIEKPRKQPVQARSTATVEAILEATLQVLVAIGKERLTTTRVAHRAGVSVGTLYQYFPNKPSLLQATLRRHLTAVSDAVEATCAAHRGQPLCDMIAAIADAFFRAKMTHPAISLALYSVSSDVDGLRIVEDLRIRNTQALSEALASSPEKLNIPLDLAAFMLQAAMTGVSRRLLEAKVPTQDHEALRTELITLLCAYIQTHTNA
ncbi:MAG: TetR/AcrR family transcriptional regulator [Acidobacteriota bacterium]